MWNRLLPAKLKYRMFAAVLLFILIPFAIVQFNQFQRIELTVREQISHLNRKHLEQMKFDFEEIKTKALLTMLQFEKDPQIVPILRHPEQYDEDERMNVMSAKINRLQSQLSLRSYVYYTVTDFAGNTYTSYSPRQPLQHDTLMREAGIADLLAGDVPYKWVFDRQTYLQSDLSPYSKFLTLYGKIVDQNQRPYGMIRIAIDYYEWLLANSKEWSLGQSFFLVSDTGDVIAQSRSGSKLSRDILRSIVQENDAADSYRFEPNSSSVVNHTLLPSMGWYLVGDFPMNLFIGDLQAMKRDFIITLSIITALLIAISFLLSLSITRPLQKLQKKMTEMAKKNLEIDVPEHGYRGEILTLVQTFNRMVYDIKLLVHQLKLEERQKEALHYQMLLNQIDPHFLLNTLNSIKWIALDEQNTKIYEISVSLGELLESSLNSELELIHMKQELELIRAYAYIQQYRFEGLFRLDYSIEPGLEYALVLKLSLQPLIENAIYHAFAHRQKGGVIRIRAIRREQLLVIEVEDNGQGLRAAQAAAANATVRRRRKGIGLSNMKERLRLLFRDQAGMELCELDTGTLVRFWMPLLISAPKLQEGFADVETIDRRG